MAIVVEIQAEDQPASGHSTPAGTTPRSLEFLADAIFEAEARNTLISPLRRPSATYRLQMHAGFRFDQADQIVDYLAELGISDVYFSPYLAAREGSTHGYDVTDHTRINPEVGDEASHQRLLNHLKSRGMGRVLDIVPNHMGFSPSNPFMHDMLENGPQARSAIFFDVDWNPVKESLTGRFLLPILGDFYDNILESGQLQLKRVRGEFQIRYHERTLPLRPRSYAKVLNYRSAILRSDFGPEAEDVLEYLSIRDSARHLPSSRFCSLAEMEYLRQEKQVIKRRLERLCSESPRIRMFLDDSIKELNGVPEDARSFDKLHELLDEQVYRLSYWRVAAEEINYRRFFDVTELAGIRVEIPEVFDHVHRLIFQWVREGGVTGLRVDHPDGLADPRGYFRRVQEELFVQACQERANALHAPWNEIESTIRSQYAAAVTDDSLTGLARRFPIVAEKILSTGERLPSEWPIDGTVGYEYLNALNGLFVKPDAFEAVDSTYRDFTNDRETFAETLRDSKIYIERALLASELNNLTRILSRAAEGDRRSRDFTINDLRRALVEVVACFRVYRTYIQPGEPVAERDREYIEQAVARARSRHPTVDQSVFAFVRDVLLLRTPHDISEDDRALWHQFTIRFQQTTGPVQAKGLEDTTFYRQVPLVSLNEVGGDPSRFATSPSAFHALNSQRLSDWPGGFSATSTHDTKRGADARIRINVISELIDEWKVRLARWSYRNARRRINVHDRECPDAREEYLLYQTLLGAWPFESLGDEAPSGFVERVQAYMVKAASEAKRNTTWTDADPSYKEALAKYVSDVLEGPDAAPFLNDFLTFQRRVARVGVPHSLALTLLKLLSPGAVDVYQGSDLWDFSMVDPDNRRPVDFSRREQLLHQLKSRLESGESRRDVAQSLYQNPEDGAIKLYLLWVGLNHRKANPDLYLKGAYRPGEIVGDLKEHAIAIGRTYQGKNILGVAPRLVAGMMGEDGSTPPIGRDIWGDTEISIPEAAPSRWLNLLTGEVVEVSRMRDRPGLPLAELFSTLPLALLVDEVSASTL
jgi:(1->4)-alpha-D-glucan 1-alpha-D-glucosylmutase